MLFSRRFFPYFVTQCLGALNDNVFKNVLLLLVAYSQLDELPIDVNLFVNLAAGLFILPFLLFSAHAGQIADYVDKALLIRRLKFLELMIMTVAIFAILSHSYLVMLLLLFLTGVQSAYFGPVKYSLLPRVLESG
ncbi:MFS transporter, partial [Shewanella frigidimarina]